MKIITIILLSFLFHLNGLSSDTLVKFHDCQFTVPGNFEALNAADLEAFKSLGFKKDILTVFKNKESLPLQFTMMVFYDSLESVTRDLSFQEIVDLKLDVLKENHSELEDYTIDFARHMAYGKLEAADGTYLFGFAVNKYGIYSFQYLLYNGVNPGEKALFSKIMHSVKQEFPYKFEKKQNPKVAAAKKEMGKSGLIMTIGLFAMVGIWLFRKYALKE